MITKQKGTNDVYGVNAKKKKYVCDVIDAICEKYNLTIEEASAYFNIGADRIRDIAEEHKNEMVIMVGVKKLIRRKKMEEYMEKIMVV